MSDNNNGEARFIQKWNAWYWVERNDKHMLYYGPYPTREDTQRITCGSFRHPPLRTSLRPTPTVTGAALLCTVAVVAMLPRSAEAQQSPSFYDQRGSFAGSSIRNSGGTTVLLRSQQTLQRIVHNDVAQTIEPCLQVAKL